jgi:hypothetical protein
VFSEYSDTAKTQLAWLINHGYSRQIELYSSLSNEEVAETIRKALGHCAPIGGFDIVKFQPGTTDLNQDTWPVADLLNGAVSLVAFFQSCKHAFIFDTNWRHPAGHQQEQELLWLRDWYAMTKARCLELYSTFDEDDNPLMKEILGSEMKGTAKEQGLDTPKYQKDGITIHYQLSRLKISLTNNGVTLTVRKVTMAEAGFGDRPTCFEALGRIGTMWIIARSSSCVGRFILPYCIRDALQASYVPSGAVSGSKVGHACQPRLRRW